MDKLIRKAVRCYVIKDNKVLAIQYKDGQLKNGYYDIPGGKIEDGESPEQTAIREIKEETGVSVNGLKHKGIMTVEYPNRKFIMDVFYTDKYDGEPWEAEENLSELIDIKDLLNKEKILSCIKLLDENYIKGLINDNLNFEMYIEVDEDENILEIDYEDECQKMQEDR